MLLNESSNEEMVQIMENLQDYVPKIDAEEGNDLPSGGAYLGKKPCVCIIESMCVALCKLFTQCTGEMKHVLFCGDQLTVERARSSQNNRINSRTKKDALLGLEPTISDWHAEANFLQVACNFEINDLFSYHPIAHLNIFNCR